jgi:hypothetical protein
MCIGRAVFFATLAIFCTMVGCAFNPVLAFRAGAIFTLFLAAVLHAKSRYAYQQAPKRTEIWLYLDEAHKPKDSASIHQFATVISSVYNQFATYAFYVATGLFAVSLGFSAMGFGGTNPTP